MVENEYELFGKGSTTTTSSAGTVIYRPEAAVVVQQQKKGRRIAPDPPPRATSVAESKEIREALDQLNNPPRPESCNAQRIRAKTQIVTLPAMCVVTPPPSDDESIRSNGGGGGGARVNVNEFQSISAAATAEAHPIVIRAQVVKSPSIINQGLVALSQLTLDDHRMRDNAPPDAADTASIVASSASSRSSSRSNSLERNSNNKRASGGGVGERRQGARVTLDADGKVVFSSDSLRRRKNHQSGHSTFESSPSPAPHAHPPPAVVTSQSAFRPNPIGFANPPPYRPAPSVLRTQPDGQQSNQPSAAISRSDSYRMANVLTGGGVGVGGEDANHFQRSDSYRRATVAAALKLGPSPSPVRQLTTVRPISSAIGAIISESSTGASFPRIVKVFINNVYFN